MPTQKREYFYKNTFKDTARPNQEDFLDVWDSFVNLEDDPLSIDSDNNFVFEQGLRISDSPSEALGTIRFRGGIFEFREVTGWKPLGVSSGGGVFLTVDGTSNVAYNDGRVGIGTGASSTDYFFEARIGINDGPSNQIRLGSAVIHDKSGGGTPDRAHFSHFDNANNNDFALRQRQDGSVNLNAPLNEPIRITQGGGTVRLMVEETGQIVIGDSVSNTTLANNPDVKLFVVGQIMIINPNNPNQSRIIDWNP